MSIDVSLAAWSISFAYAHALNSQPPDIWWLLLPLSVWIIYTFDHLMDSRKLPLSAAPERYLIHKQYFRFLFAIISIVAASILMLSFIYFPLKFITQAIALGMCVVGYFAYSILNHKYIIPREIIVVIVFTLGVCFGPIYYSPNEVNYILVVSIFITCMANLCLFSKFEKLNHEILSKTNMFSSLTLKQADIICYTICTFGILLNIILLFYFGFSPLIFSLLIIDAIYLCLIYFQERMKIHYLYRIKGDGVLILPGIFTLCFQCLSNF
ncbi:MAG: hypothetical protein SFY32_16965 [Bacteroidota bacterium]|nr:hypothetical protein [Bacteroidota bacterium]